MFDYTTVDSSLSQAQSLHTKTVWAHHPLLAVAPAILTPFSYSIVAEILRRGWFDYQMRIGLEPQPAARLVQQYQGRAYLNLSLTAHLEGAAGIEPLSLQINGIAQTIAPVKSSFLGGILGNRQEKKVWSVVSELESEAQSVRQKAREWLHNVLELKWSQAEILQVMEQIERVGSDSMMLFFAARHNLELGLNHILSALQASAPFPQSLAYARTLFSGFGNTHLANLIESDLSKAVMNLAQLARNEGIEYQDLRNWRDWSDSLPHGKFKAGVAEFLDDYGHRAAGESELRNPRWHEDPTFFIASVLALASRETTGPTSGNLKGKEELLQAVDAKARKSVQQWLDRFPTLLRLQSQALDAFAYILAGSRRWIQAAAQEAMADGRLTSEDDAFYFALEELKEMMTGERNVSATDEIRTQLAERQAEFDAWQEATPGSMLVGDQELDATRSGLPLGADIGVTMDAATSLSYAELGTVYEQLVAAGNTLQVSPLDAGNSSLLPLCNSLIVPHGHLLDPAVAAAWASQKVVVGV